jgi:hypothetical protein
MVVHFIERRPKPPKEDEIEAYKRRALADVQWFAKEMFWGKHKAQAKAKYLYRERRTINSIASDMERRRAEQLLEQIGLAEGYNERTGEEELPLWLQRERLIEQWKETRVFDFHAWLRAKATAEKWPMLDPRWKLFGPSPEDDEDAAWEEFKREQRELQ